MVVMAPFRDELSHGQWFRERLPPPHLSPFTERVKSSLRLAEDRAQWNCRGAPSLSRHQFQEWILKYATDYHTRIPGLESRDSLPPTCRPLPREGGRLLHTNPRFAFLSIFSTIFPPLHRSPRFIRNHRGQTVAMGRVVLRAARLRIRGVQWNEGWKKWSGGRWC